MYFVIRAFEDIYQGEEGKENITIEYARDEIDAEYIAHDLSVELMYDYDEIMGCIYDMAEDIARENGIENVTSVIHDVIEDNVNYDIYPIIKLDDHEIADNLYKLEMELEDDFDSFLITYC